jgi:hypothetical protein
LQVPYWLGQTFLVARRRVHGSVLLAMSSATLADVARWRLW